MPSWRSPFRGQACREVSKFQPLSTYDAAADGQYQLLPFKFTQLEGDRYVITNMVGEYAIVPRRTVHALVSWFRSSLAYGYRECFSGRSARLKPGCGPRTWST